MNASIRRFNLRQTVRFFPRRVWPYLALLVVGFYASVVTEQRLLFTVLVGFAFLMLLIRYNKASECVLLTGPQNFVLHYKRGVFSPRQYTLEYHWSNLIYYRCKLTETTDPTLQMHWDQWEDTCFSGRDLNEFCQYLRDNFPEKEIFTATDP